MLPFHMWSNGRLYMNKMSWALPYLEYLKAICHIILFYLTKPIHFLQCNFNLHQIYQMTGRLLKEMKTIFSTWMLVIWEIAIYLRNMNLQKSPHDILLPFFCAMNVTVSISTRWYISATQRISMWKLWQLMETESNCYCPKQL